MEPGDFSDWKVGMRAVYFRRGMPFGFPCAPVTLRRAKRIYGPATAVSTGNLKNFGELSQVFEKEGVTLPELPLDEGRQPNADRLPGSRRDR